MQVSLASTAWVGVHLIAAGVMAMIGYLDLVVWWRFRAHRALRASGMLCWSVASTLVVGAVGLSLPVVALARITVPLRALLVGVTAALFLQALGALVRLAALRTAVVLSVLLPLAYGVIGLFGGPTYSFPDGSSWPKVEPLGNVLIGISTLILVAYIWRSVLLLERAHRNQLVVAAVCMTVLLVLGIGAGRGVLTEAMTSLWTLPIAVLMAKWCSARILTSQRSMVSAVAGWREAERVVEYQARHDQVTGLPNRAVAAETLQKMLDGSDATSAIAVSAVRMSRLEELRSIEGPYRVDIFLRSVADHLAAARPANVVVARVGDGSFVVLTAITVRSVNAASGESIVEQAVLNLRRNANFPAEVVISVGVCISDENSTAQELLHRAEMAATAAEQGNTVVQFYRPELAEIVSERAKTRQLLKGAIERDELEVHYQPVIDTKSMDRVGVEALVRWRHQGRLHPPLEWLPLAEQLGLMENIGYHVLQTAIRDFSALGCPIAVNVSPSQFADRHFVSKILRSLEAAPAGAISLEVTEGSIAMNQGEAGVALSELRDRGIRIALDDFGTEYSSLSRLVLLPFDVLKIDRSFVANIVTPEGEAIVTAIHAMAHAIGKTTVAEGVETAEQLRIVREIGCDCVQGYFTGRAKPVSEYLATEQIP